MPLIIFAQKNGVFYAPDKIDESVQLPVLDGVPDPIKLNMSLVRMINSYGTRKLLGFVRGLGGRKIEFYECPSVFIDTVNIVRDLLGEAHDPRSVVSYSIPHYCDQCSAYVDIMFKYADVRPDEEGLGLPAQRCLKCGGNVYVDVDPEEYLAFILEKS